MSTHETTRTSPEASDLARRVGPVVAGVGLLVAVAVLVWVAVAPDNVVGTVAEAGIDVPAVAAVDVDAGGCIELVGGDGAARTTCTTIEDAATTGGQPWWVDDQLVVETRDGPVLVDPETGEVSEESPDDVDRGRPEPLFREVWVDGGVVRRGDWGDDGEVLLDLGGPVGRLRDATLSPDERWVVATDEQDRVLVARTDQPDEVLVWFELDEDGWFDVRRQVRWEE